MQDVFMGPARGGGSINHPERGSNYNKKYLILKWWGNKGRGGGNYNRVLPGWGLGWLPVWVERAKRSLIRSGGGEQRLRVGLILLLFLSLFGGSFCGLLLLNP